ncbi:major facilitator superfamily MFS_1 [Pyrobaculum islandicum DSM 4184]|uniref:Major facilitator superfamily MFS_1 n=1 Tax=Pyrobaculum islandicum (strain DSM 4184 / JCM 9189 / GEO3) TaxID=384616 RepID=A1RVY7_PYRIL|nr:MFS transporter [Pyrobaculum islandicum]ABL89119.1 major facilitator superfamily MFS_1 [Pyrobaculum islandicum DSM 4184]
MISQWKLITITGIGWLFDAMDVLLLSYILVASAAELGMGVWERSVVVLANNLGMLIGATAFGRLSDRLGRRAVFTATLLLYSLATAATAFVKTGWELAAVRLIAGLGLGGELPVVASYVSELSPPDRRGRNVVILESFWSLGALAAAAVAYFLFPRLGWRTALLLLGLTALYAAVIRATLPEHKPAAKGAVSIETRRLYPVWYIWLVLAFGYYGVFLWLPTILVRERGLAEVQTYQFMLITTIAQIPGYFTAAYLVEKIGRRPTAAIFFLGSAASAAALIYSVSLPQLYISAIALNFFNLGAWGVVYAYTPELFPEHVRGFATGTAGSAARVGMILGPWLYPAAGLYALVAVPLLWLTVPAAVYTLPETKRR